MRRHRLPPARVPGLVALHLIAVALPTGQALGRPAPVAGGTGAEVRVTWRDIRALVDRHPRVAEAAQRSRAARAAIDAAGAVPNPELTARAAYGRARDAAVSRTEWALELAVPLGWIARRGPKIHAARAEAGVVEAESAGLRRQVLLRLRTHFWNLVHAQERVAALTELDAQTAALASVVKQRVEKGESRPVEAVRATVVAEQIAGELALARATLEARRAQLGLWLGLRPARRLVATADLAALPSPLPAARAVQRVQAGHPGVVAARARVDALEAGVRLERRARLPSVSIQAFTDHELDRAAYGAGLVVELPLWSWNSGRIRRAEAELAAGRQRLAADRLELELSVVEARASCKGRVELARRYRDQILPQATTAARTIERTYELGEAPLLEVIDARRTLLETKSQLLTALRQAQLACSRLAILAGEDLP